jgi:4-hydroxy-4-methyl-2-oxoglutarate aldolase
MIKDPPLLTIRRNFARPSPEQISAFANVPTGHAVDAMGGRGALDYRIKPLTQLRSVMVGTAITCHCGPADNLALVAAIATAKAGDVLVAATDGCTVTSVTGDLLMGMARNRGIAGLVTDGVVRDLAGILSVGLPVYCVGLSPNSAARSGPGSLGLPVVIGGVTVASGDLIVADNDGVVAVPGGEIEKIIAQLAEVRKAEAALEAKVKGGLGFPDYIQKILSSERVQEVP